MARARSRGGAQRWLASGGLLAFGAVIGIMLGAILDGPRMLVRRWTEEVQVIEIPRPSVDAPALEEYRKLQGSQVDRPVPPAEPDPAAKKPSVPVPEKRPAQETRRPEPPPSTARKPEAPSRSADSPSPEALIAEIQQKRDAPPSAPPQQPAPEPVATSEGRSGPTVQVAAYRDANAAETLVRRLRRAGYDAYLSDRRADGPNKYRVRVQAPRGSSIKSLADTLEERGYGVWVTRE